MIFIDEFFFMQRILQILVNTRLKDQRQQNEEKHTTELKDLESKLNETKEKNKQLEEQLKEKDREIRADTLTS